MPHPPYLSAQQVADELGVSVQTVYAYVSRGLLRSERQGSHARRYLREDVEKLKQRKESRRNPASVAAGALHWGTPVLDSAITLIAEEHLYYRGRSALELATSASVEQVAALIWQGTTEGGERLFADVRPSIPRLSQAGLMPLDAFAAVLPLAAAEDVAAFDLRPAAQARTGARVLYLLAAVAAAEPGDLRVAESAPVDLSGGIVAALARRWCPRDPAAPALINAALILCADHELNVSSFTARCVASAGATLYAVASAGLAALSGFKHGKQAELTSLLLEELSRVDDVRASLSQKLRLGQPIPGFEHTLYPHGDPRGRLLLELTRAAYPDAPDVALAKTLVEAVYGLIGEYPTVDTGLAVLARVLGLPPGGALGLFALGRTIGWIGHALEQYADDRLIRPRARYVGEMPRRPAD